MSRSILHVATVVLLLAPVPASAQWPPDRLKNLQVLPDTLTVQEVTTIMAGFTRALGVRCSACHVGEEGAPLASYDFAADDRVLKVKAREMLRMVAEINDRHLAGLASRSDPPARVQCVTCHRGVRVPRPLQDELLLAYHGGGLDSLRAEYHRLRGRYFGRAAYDFGGVTLADVGDRLREADALRDAEAIHALNVEANPGDWFPQWRHAWAALLLSFVEEGVDAGAARYAELRERYLPRAMSEDVVNDIGYDLLGRGHLAEGVALLRLNAEAYPESWNAHDSLGEAYARAGERDLAIRSYRRSLQLNPANENARTRLRELGAR